MPSPKIKSRRLPAQRGRSLPDSKAVEAPEPAAEEQPRRRKHYVQPQVLEMIRAANGQPVTLKEITDKLLCPDSSVQHAVLKLRETVPQILVITKGQAWKWDYKVTDLSRPEDTGTPRDEAAQVLTAPEPPRPEVPGSKYGERYITVGRDQEGNRIVREEGDDPTLYLLSPL